MKVIDLTNSALETWRPGVETRMVVSRVNGAAQLCIFERWVAPGHGAPTHAHPVDGARCGSTSSARSSLMHLGQPVFNITPANIGGLALEPMRSMLARAEELTA